MAKYVMSDLHGCYDKFIKMLNKIQFSEKDELYILGDIFDRGDKPLDILDYIISHKNIHLIKGNHEEFFNYYGLTNDMSLWMLNGGDTTLNQLLEKHHTYEESILKYLKKLPFIKVVDRFILVHAGVYFPQNYEELTIDEFIELQEEDICLWERSHIGNEKKFKDYTVVVGHTPVQTITNDIENVKMLHRNGYIYIDGGCCFEKANGKLLCLRLDDMKEFSV